MIYPDVTLEDWLRKHPELQVLKKTCDSCGKDMFSTVPFMTKDYYGLESPKCSCGKNRNIT